MRPPNVPTAMRFDLPSPDFETQPFWDGCKEGGSCCGIATRAARTTSTRGRSARSAGAPTSSGRTRAGAGALYTYSVVRQNDLPPFPERVPYVAAIVELDEGPRVMTNIEGCRVRRPGDRHARSRSTSSAISDDVTIPVFRPAS